MNRLRLRAQRAIEGSAPAGGQFVSQQLAADFLGATEYAEPLAAMCQERPVANNTLRMLKTHNMVD